MSDILEVIEKRRSHRKYRPEQIKREEIERIVRAARATPTGGNWQGLHFLVIQDKEVLDRLAKLVIEQFRRYEVTESVYINIRRAISLAKDDSYHFFYHAPTMVVVAGENENLNGFAEAGAAMQNMMLEATELGIANCWVNQLRWLDDNETIHEYLVSLGLKSNEVVRASLALGYPEGNISEKAPGPARMEVTYI